MAGDWRVATLDQLGRIVTGKTPPSGREDCFGGDIPFVTPTDFDGRRQINSTGRYLTDEGAHSVSSSRLPAGAVMVSCIGSDMGKAALAARDCVTNQQINSIVVDPAQVPLFVYYNLSTRKAEIRNAASGSAQPILNKSAFGRLDILLPPADEQRAIAHILSTLDDKIELNRRMNETLEAMARALFTSWFVDFEPVRAKAEGRDPALPKPIADLFPDRFEDSELSEIPAGWEVGPLQDVLVLQRGFDLPTSARTPGPYPVLAASGPNGSHNEFLVRGPGVSTGRSGVLGKVFYVHDDFWPLNTSLWVKEFRRSTAAYAFHLLRRLNLAVFNAGSAVPTLNRNHVHNLPTLMPPFDLICAFDAVAVSLMQRQRVNGNESLTLGTMRDTLLPKLVTGELRVMNRERSAGMQA